MTAVSRKIFKTAFQESLVYAQIQVYGGNSNPRGRGVPPPPLNVAPHVHKYIYRGVCSSTHYRHTTHVRAQSHMHTCIHSHAQIYTHVHESTWSCRSTYIRMTIHTYVHTCRDRSRKNIKGGHHLYRCICIDRCYLCKLQSKSYMYVICSLAGSAM